MNNNFECLCTGSTGNCYLLKVGSSLVVLDAGGDFKKLTSSVNLNDVEFAYISHEHQDHSKNLKNLILRGVKCLDGITNQETIKNQINAKNGGFLQVLRVPIKHGKCNNSALIIKSEEELILYATDFNRCEYDLSKFKFTRVIVECNYIESMVVGVEDIKVKRQINTHMGLEGLQIFLDKLDLSKCQEIDLIHMSQGYGNPILMGSTIYSKYRIKTGVCKQYGGIDYYG